MQKIFYPVLIIALFLCFSSSAFSQEEEVSEPEPEIEALKNKSLEEILEREKTSRYKKIDQFLKDFDRGFAKNMGEKFEDLLVEEAFVDGDDEISTDSFETFNEEFDKVIEEDLADFEMFEIDIDKLEMGLNLEKPSITPRPAPEEPKGS